MAITVAPERLAQIVLEKGAHDPGQDMCLMEAVAYVLDLRWTDRPPCVSPVLGAFGRSINDALPSDIRQRLVPLIPLLPGTAQDGHDEARGYLALDWLVRTYLPTWFDQSDFMRMANELRHFGAIGDIEAAHRVGHIVKAHCNAVIDEVERISCVSNDFPVDVGDSAYRAVGAIRDLDALDADVVATVARQAWLAARYARLVAGLVSEVTAELQESAINLFHRMINPEGITTS